MHHDQLPIAGQKTPAAVMKIFIPGRPVPKARPRAAVGSKSGKPFMYTPKKTQNAEYMLKRFGADWMRRNGWTSLWLGPMRLTVYFMTEKPKKWWPGKEPTALCFGDCDNLVKTVKDGLNGVVYKDDSQFVAYAGVRKLYYETPGVLVIVEFFNLIEAPVLRKRKPKA